MRNTTIDREHGHSQLLRHLLQIKDKRRYQCFRCECVHVRENGIKCPWQQLLLLLQDVSSPGANVLIHHRCVVHKHCCTEMHIGQTSFSWFPSKVNVLETQGFSPHSDIISL